jgi:hypothetical protein
MRDERNDPVNSENLLKGLIAGAIGGFVASAVMNKFQQLFSDFLIGEERSHGAQSIQTGTPQHGIGRKLDEFGLDDPKDDSAERLANAASVGILGHKPTEGEKRSAGTALHYGYGISMGAVYGAAAEMVPNITTGAGMPYGAAIWLGADEGVVPLLGLSKSPSEYPLSVHAVSLASHLVYGLTADVVRQGVRASL